MASLAAVEAVWLAQSHASTQGPRRRGPVGALSAKPLRVSIGRPDAPSLGRALRRGRLAEPGNDVPGVSPCCWPLAAVKEHVGELYGPDFRFAVVVARFNDIVTRPLLAGALEAFRRHGVPEESVEVVWVPGSFEIPVVTQALAKTGKFNAILTLGAVVRGSTTHYEAVVGAAESGVLSAGLSTGVPCIFGVLTCENMDQAFDRAGGKVGNKGAETAITAIEMASLMAKLNKL